MIGPWLNPEPRVRCSKGKVLLFVGSGASTEAHNVMAGEKWDLANCPVKAGRASMKQGMAVDVSAPLPGAEVIHTSAAYFVELLDQALVRAGYLLPLTITTEPQRLTGDCGKPGRAWMTMCFLGNTLWRS